MARGWESKSVESQMEDRAWNRRPAGEPPLDDEQRRQRARREALLLQRTRVLGELQAACNPRFRGQLEAELHWLDTEIAQLSGQM
jgi:hypothetical protein